MSETLPPLELDTSLLIQAHELVHVGTWMWDVRSNTVLWSDELFRMFGLEPQSIELDFETFLSRVHPDDVDHVTRRIGATQATGSQFQFDHRIIRPDGEV